MSKRHGIHTDASHRFERGADFESTLVSTNRVAELILESGGGTLVGDVIDVIARKLDLAPVELDLREVHRILGEKLPTHRNQPHFDAAWVCADGGQRRPVPGADSELAAGY